MAGYIRIDRRIFDDPAFYSVRFPRPWALIDLIQMARYKPGGEFVNGRYVSLERGQLCKSIRALATRWKWDEKTVSSFLKELSIGGLITLKFPQSKGGLTNVISIVNYDSFDDDSNSESHTDSYTDSHVDSHSDSHAIYIENKEEYNTSDTNVSSYSIPKERREEKKKEKEEDTGVSSKKDGADFPFIQKLWNDSMARTGKIPKVASISQARKDKINLRISEMGGWENAKKTIAECFRKINESDFCNGENDQVWVATFDWFFKNEKNWLKVFEGNYDNRHRKTQLEILADNIRKADEYYERQYAGASAYGVPPGGGFDGPDEQ